VENNLETECAPDWLTEIFFEEDEEVDGTVWKVDEVDE